MQRRSHTAAVKGSAVSSGNARAHGFVLQAEAGLDATTQEFYERARDQLSRLVKRLAP